MPSLKVYDLLHRRALITRGSADAIRVALADAATEEDVTLDFAGVEAVTPSFVDEVLAIVEGAVSQQRRGNFRLVFLHPPTRLSSKFAAVGRARHLQIVEENGAWIITAGLAPSVR